MGASFVDYRPLPRSNGGSQPNAQHLTTSGLSCEVTANRQALQALRCPRIAGCRNWINQLLPPGITCTLCRSSDSPRAARHHSTIVSFMTHYTSVLANNLGLAWDEPNSLTSHEHRVHSFRSRHNRVRHRAGCKEICWDGCVTRIAALASPSYHIPIIWSHNYSHARYHTCRLPSRRYL